MEQGLESFIEVWDNLDQSVQEVLIILGLLLMVWLARRIMARTFTTRLHRLTRQSGNQWDDLVVNVIERPLRYFMIAIMLSATTIIIHFDERTERLITRVSSTIIIGAIFLLIYALLNYTTQSSRLMDRILGVQVDDKLLPFIRTALKIVVIAFAAVIVIREWGYDVNGLIAGLGIGGLAFALAAQDTLSNLFGFTMIVSDQPFVEGDYIKTPDVEGVVENVGLRSTRVRQADQAVVSVPNSKLTNSAILNWSRVKKRRVDFTLKLDYNTTSGQLQQFLGEVREMLKSREAVERNSAVVYFINFGEAGLEVLVRCYLLIPDWGEFTAEKEAIILTIMDIMDHIGLRVAVPAPTMTIADLPQPVREALLDHVQHTAQPPARRIKQADDPGSLSAPSGDSKASQ
jgi:MscS family membrane protein